MFRSPDEDPDARLLSGAAKGNERSLKLLVQRHERLLFGIAFQMLGNREDAEEAAASAFVALWKSADRHRGEASVKAYLCSILLNLCRDRLRQRRDVVAFEAPSGEANDDLIMIRCALSHLAADDREALTLHHVEGLTTQEAADALGIEQGAFKMRLVRARQRLRTLLEDKND